MNKKGIAPVLGIFFISAGFLIGFAFFASGQFDYDDIYLRRDGTNNATGNIQWLSDNSIMFRDSDLYINSPSNGVLDIVSDNFIRFSSPTTRIGNNTGDPRLEFDGSPKDGRIDYDATEEQFIIDDLVNVTTGICTAEGVCLGDLGSSGYISKYDNTTLDDFNVTGIVTIGDGVNDVEINLDDSGNNKQILTNTGTNTIDFKVGNYKLLMYSTQLIPNVQNTFNIGSSSFEFKNGYFKNVWAENEFVFDSTSFIRNTDGNGLMEFITDSYFEFENGINVTAGNDICIVGGKCLNNTITEEYDETGVRKLVNKNLTVKSYSASNNKVYNLTLGSNESVDLAVYTVQGFMWGDPAPAYEWSIDVDSCDGTLMSEGGSYKIGSGFGFGERQQSFTVIAWDDEPENNDCYYTELTEHGGSGQLEITSATLEKIML